MGYIILFFAIALLGPVLVGIGLGIGDWLSGNTNIKEEHDDYGGY